MFISPFVLMLTKGIRGRLLLKALLGLCVGATYLWQIYCLSAIVSGIYAHASLQGMLPLFAGILSSVLLRSLMIWFESYYGKMIIGKVKIKLRQRCYEKLLRLGPGFLTGSRTGKIEADIVAGIDYLEGYLTAYIPQVLVCLISAVVYVGFLAYLHPVLAGIVAVSYVIALISPFVFGRPLSASSMEHWAAYEDLKSDLVDSVQGIDTLKAYGVGKMHGESLDARMKTLTKTTMKNLRINIAEVGIANFATGMGISFTLAVAAFLFTKGRITLSHLTGLLFFTAEIFRPLGVLQNYWHTAFMGYTSSKSIHELLCEKEEISDNGKEAFPATPACGLQTDKKTQPPDICFDHIRFGYAGQAPLFKDFTLHVKSGERIAIVGESGSGKSTLINLVLRFYEIGGGCLLMDGKDIRSYSLADLRKNIAIVSQDTYLFHGTIRENLAMAKPGASFEEMVSAAKSANIHAFIEGLEAGYDTRVGERGLNFSGGQRQRLSIARAILKSAPIVILDEATSSVDEENEAVIKEALNKLLENKTSLTIAHRLNTIRDAQRIVVLKQGEIAEEGTHDELISRNGAYCNLLNAQMQGR